MPATVRCRTCGLQYVPPAGRDECPQCAAPVRAARPVAEKDSVRDGVKLVLLVSAVANVVVGVLWGTTCFGLVLTGPMAVLSVFEVLLWSKADRLSDRELADRAWTLALFEVGLGVFNTPTLVCGIVALVYSGRLRDRTPARG
jgi:hypothetical protein